MFGTSTLTMLELVGGKNPYRAESAAENPFGANGNYHIWQYRLSPYFSTEDSEGEDKYPVGIANGSNGLVPATKGAAPSSASVSSHRSGRVEVDKWSVSTVAYWEWSAGDFYSGDYRGDMH